LQRASYRKWRTFQAFKIPRQLISLISMRADRTIVSPARWQIEASGKHSSFDAFTTAPGWSQWQATLVTFFESCRFGYSICLSGGYSYKPGVRALLCSAITSPPSFRILPLSQKARTRLM